MEDCYQLFHMQRVQKNKDNDLKIHNFNQLFNTQTPNRLRNSLTSNISACHLVDYRTTISNYFPQRENNTNCNKNQSNPQTSLKQQLSSLQERLNIAKREMRFNQQPTQLKKLKSQPKLFVEQRKSSTRVIQNQSKSNYLAPPQQRPTLCVENMKKSVIEQYTNSIPKPKNITTFKVNPYSSFKFNGYYLTEVVRARHEKNSLAAEHINTSIMCLKQQAQIMKNIQKKQKKQIVLPQDPKFKDKKTLILDLDETLIHCLDNSECEPDLSLGVSIEGTPITIDITIRPYALTFLKKISKKWEVIVFTASHQEYADAILDEIDPDNIIFQHRLYRQHCTLSQQVYVKDLSSINRDLGKMVLVDNSAYSYILQLENAIPILPYYDGKDFQLSALQNYLQKLEKSSDICKYNEEYFKLHRYQQFQHSIQLIEQLYATSHIFI